MFLNLPVASARDETSAIFAYFHLWGIFNKFYVIDHIKSVLWHSTARGSCTDLVTVGPTKV